MNDENAGRAASDAQALVRCEVTGKLVAVEDTVEFHGRTVSAEGKEILLRELRNSDDASVVGEELVRPGFWRRFLCSILDSAILIAVFAVLTVVILAGSRRGADHARILMQFMIIAGIVSFLYFALMHATFGKTLGKMAGGFRVVNMDGTPITTHTAFMRAFWSSGILVVITVLGITTASEETMGWVGNIYNLVNGIVLVADGDYNRALHDRLAGTRTVMDPWRK